MIAKAGNEFAVWLLFGCIFWLLSIVFFIGIFDGKGGK